MELVYLWVEDYKNIHHQGFNFSPRFDCKFHDKYEKYIDEDGEKKERLKDNCKLEIIEKKEDEYIKDFFGKNINVTAIVGKNGSGKSSVLQWLIYILETENNEDVLYLEPDFEYLIIFYFDEKFLLLSNILNISSNTSLNKIYQDGLYFENLKLSSFQAENPYLSIKNVYNKEEELKDNVYNLTLDYEQIIKLLLTSNQEGLITFFIPKYVLLEELSHDKILLALVKSMHEMNERKDLKVDSVKKAIEYFEYNYTLSNLEELFLLNELIYFEEKIDEQYFIEKIEKFSNGDWNKKDIVDIKTLLKEFSFRTFSEYEQLCSHDDYILISEDLDINLLFKYIDLLEIRVLDINKIDFEVLSHGEKYLIGIFLNILESIDIEKNNFIFLDEPDLSFHPQWQKEYINRLISFLKNLDSSINIIFTTHSPFLLSDIPRQNIIFLDRYKEDDKEVKNEIQKEGNCKVVDGLSQTFGANIHTLLSDSFFMEGGLMGEFAKAKINEIKIFYEKVIKEKKTKENEDFYKTNQKKFWQIQKIIGEPFLQKIVQNQLEEIELILLGRNEAIDREIERLQALKKSANA